MNTKQYSFLLLSWLLFSWAAQSSEWNSNEIFGIDYVEIKESDFGAYGVFNITNISGRDIDDLALNIYLNNEKGDMLSSTAVTDATPGLVWVKNGDNWKVEVPLDRRKGARELLENEPENAELVIEIKTITFAE